MRCVQVCEKVQGMNVWDVVGTGLAHDGRTYSHNRRIEGYRLHAAAASASPTARSAALRERDDTGTCLRRDRRIRTTITVVQVAPAVRAAWGEQLRASHSELATRQAHGRGAAPSWASTMCSTPISAADLTIMEEGSEFLEASSHRKEVSAGRCSRPAARAGCAL